MTDEQTSPATPGVPSTPAAARREKTKIGDILFGWRAAIAIFLAGLIVGGLAGAVMFGGHGDHGGRGHHGRGGYGYGYGGPGGGFGGFHQHGVQPGTPVVPKAPVAPKTPAKPKSNNG